MTSALPDRLSKPARTSRPSPVGCVCPAYGTFTSNLGGKSAKTRSPLTGVIRPILCYLSSLLPVFCLLGQFLPAGCHSRPSCFTDCFVTIPSRYGFSQFFSCKTQQEISSQQCQTSYTNPFFIFCCCESWLLRTRDNLLLLHSRMDPTFLRSEKESKSLGWSLRITPFFLWEYCRRI